MAIQLANQNKIILVDDDEMELDIFRRVLKQSNLPNEFYGIQSATACLEFLQTVADEKEPMPALLLIDVRMPGTNGFELVEQIRSIPYFKTLPIIAMFSNSDAEADMQRAIRVGANAFQVKPAGIESYVQFLNSLQTD